ncbi:MAG TPA: TonB-dependent receptor [Arenicellales bacterium]|nr:TonB-dependent receptor [Arenicellales bacterium]
MSDPVSDNGPQGALSHCVRSLAVLAPVLMWATAGPAAAQDSGETGASMALNPVTISATRTDTPVSELTRSVTIVPAIEIDQQKRIDRSVGEILSKSVPGFSPSTEALTDFGQTLRGRTFLTLIDGMPQSTPLRDGRRSLNSIDADAIERIEVVRGGTAAYGFGAAGGLVNIITRRPEAGELNGHSEVGAKVSATETDDSLEWHTSHRVSGRSGKIDYLLSGTFVQRNSFFDADGDRIPADPFGVQGGLADTDEYSFLGKLGHEFDGGDQRLELSFNRFDVEQDTEFEGLGNGDPAAGIKTPAVRGDVNVKNPGTKNTTVNLQYRNEDWRGSNVRSQVYYGDLTTRFSKFPGFPQVEVNSEKLGARLTVDTPVELNALSFNAIWGVDYLNDETEQPALDGPDETPRMEQDAIAGFLELELPVSDRAQIRGGLRHESMSVDVDDITNRQGVFVRGGTLDFDETLFNIGGTYFLNDRSEVFASFSQGFSLADIGRAISDTTVDDATLLESEVQVVDNYELGLRGQYQNWNGSITAFYSESDNGTTFNPDLVINKQPERIHGIELAADFNVSKSTRVGGTLSWLEGEVDLDDDGQYEEDLPSTRIPPTKVTAFGEYVPNDRWSARLQALYSGNRDPDSSQFGGGDVDSYLVFDLYGSLRLPRGQLQLGVENLLNEDYFTVLSQAGELPYAFSKGSGRTVSLTYSLDW